MAKIFSLYSSLILLLVNLIAPMLPPCDTCNSTGYVTCHICEGDGFVYSDSADIMVTCNTCGGKSRSACTVCPDAIRDFYIYRTELNEALGTGK